MKRFLALFLSLFLIFSFIGSSNANLIEGLKDVNPNTKLETEASSNSEDGKLSDPKFEDSNETGNKLLSLFIDFGTGIFQVFLAPLIAIAHASPSLEGTIWGQQPYFQLSFFEATNSGLAGTLQSTIGSFYNAMRYMVASIYIVILVYLGIRMILSSVGRQKAHYKTLLQYWLTGLLLLFAFHWVMAFIIWISNTLTHMLSDVGSEMIAGLFAGKQVLGTDVSTVTDLIIYRITSDSALDAFGPTLGIFILFVKALLIFTLIVYGIFISFTYFKRLFTIALLIVLFPIVVLSYVFDKIGDRDAQTFKIWFKEFTVNVLVQPIHALLLLFVAIILTSDLFSIPVIGALLILLPLALIPIGETQIKKLFQISSSMGPGSHGIAGSLAHAGMAANSLKNLSSSIVEKGKSLKNLATANRLTRQSLNAAGNKASKSAVASGASYKDQKKAWKDAVKAEKKSLKNNSAYKEKMKELTGCSSSGKATAKLLAGNTVGTLAGAAGFAKALATTNNIGDLGKNIVSNTAAGAFAGKLAVNSVANGVSSIAGLASGYSSPELDKAIRLASGNLNKLSNAEKAHIAKVTGINKRNIKENCKDGNFRDLVNKRLNARKKALEFGIKYDDKLINNFDINSSDSEKIKNIRDGNSASNPKYKFTPSDFIAFGRDGENGYAIEKSGNVLVLPGMGDPKLKDIAWKDTSLTPKEYQNSLESKAAAIVAQQDYKDDEKRDNAKRKIIRELQAEGNSINELCNSLTPNNLDPSEVRFGDFNQVRGTFPPNHLDKVNSIINSRTDIINSAGFTNAGEMASQVQSILLDSNLDNTAKEAKLSGFNATFSSMGLTPPTDKLTSSFDEVNSYANEIRAYTDPLSIANSYDINNRTNATINSICASKNISAQKISEITGGKAKTLPELLSNLPLEEKQEALKHFQQLPTASQTDASSQENFYPQPYEEISVDELKRAGGNATEFKVVKKSDVVIVLDQDDNILLVKEHIGSSQENGTQFTIKIDDNDEIQAITPLFKSISDITKVNLLNHGDNLKNPNRDMIKSLFGK